MSRLLAILLLASGAAPAQPITVPLIVEGNAPIVELEFSSPGGVRKARFVVDTGGGALILGSRLVADIGAKPAGPVSKGEAAIVPLEPVIAKLGGMPLDLTGVRTVGVVEQVGPGSRDDAEGLIPGRLLRNYEVIFDYPARQFTLAKPGEVSPRGVKVATPISSPSAFPRIELQIGGTTYGFLLDTGASFTMISRTVLDGWARANPAWPTSTGAVGFANMSGGKIEAEALMLRLAEIGIGPISLKGVGAVSRSEGTYERNMSRFMTAPIAGALAGNVLREFRVEIDYLNGFTYLDHTGSGTDSDLVSVGLVLTGGLDKSLVVSGISSAAAADVKEQVHAGDKLLAVDDVSLQGKPLAAAAMALQGKAGARKRLSLQRDGKAVAVSVTVAKLL
jgi:hypothetical protein